MFDGGHAESFPQVVGDERGLSACFGQLPFVEGKHDEVAEIEVTRFQYSHHLHTDGRFAMKRYIRGSKQSAEKTLQGIDLQT